MVGVLGKLVEVGRRGWRGEMCAVWLDEQQEVGMERRVAGVFGKVERCSEERYSLRAALNPPPLPSDHHLYYWTRSRRFLPSSSGFCSIYESHVLASTPFPAPLCLLGIPIDAGLPHIFAYKPNGAATNGSGGVLPLRAIT